MGAWAAAAAAAPAEQRGPRPPPRRSQRASRRRHFGRSLCPSRRGWRRGRGRRPPPLRLLGRRRRRRRQTRAPTQTSTHWPGGWWRSTCLGLRPWQAAAAAAPPRFEFAVPDLSSLTLTAAYMATAPATTIHQQDVNPTAMPPPQTASSVGAGGEFPHHSNNVIPVAVPLLPPHPDLQQHLLVGQQSQAAIYAAAPIYIDHHQQHLVDQQSQAAIHAAAPIHRDGVSEEWHHQHHHHQAEPEQQQYSRYYHYTSSSSNNGI
mmetsp:Transcript_31900/g.52024  ORF Transcript_31900/g.52024 Transcript_31900/m.52024 type:complete len:261 (+) Transcript_31900:19-801(+)